MTQAVTPTKHLDRKWMVIDQVLYGTRMYVGRVQTTEAACRFLWCCNIEGNGVTILSEWTPQLRSQHKIVLTDNVAVELLVQGFCRLGGDADLLLGQTALPPAIRRVVCSEFKLAPTAFKPDHWQKAREQILFDRQPRSANGKNETDAPTDTIARARIELGGGD